MITISWSQLGEHIEKGDLKEWVKDLRQADKGTDLYVKTDSLEKLTPYRPEEDDRYVDDGK